MVCHGEEDSDQNAGMLGCKIDSFPITYLGLPMGAKFKEEAIWEPVIGRITLIKSVLASIPTYFLSLFPLPASVAYRLEALQRSFLWSSFGSDFKFHLVR